MPRTPPTRPLFSKLNRPVAWARACLLPLLLAGVASCAAAPGRSSGNDDERRSEAEYDLARDAWLRHGEPRKALSHSLRSLELNSDNADAHHLAALLYLDLCQLKGSENCRLEDAKKHAEQALKLKADYREARNTLGVVLIHMKRPTDALSVLTPLTTDILYTTPENAWGNLGWAYLESGKIDQAIEALERSVAAQPRFCVGFYRLGLARDRKGMHEAAMDAFSSALSADPRCESLQDAYLGRAKSALTLGRRDPAQEDLDTCVALSKDSAAGKECNSLRENLK